MAVHAELWLTNERMYQRTSLCGKSFSKTTFAKDPQDQAAWERYQRGILEYGGSRDELRLLEECLGRRPISAVLFHGLKPTPGS